MHKYKKADVPPGHRLFLCLNISFQLLFYRHNSIEEYLDSLFFIHNHIYKEVAISHLTSPQLEPNVIQLSKLLIYNALYAGAYCMGAFGRLGLLRFGLIGSTASRNL